MYLAIYILQISIVLNKSESENKIQFNLNESVHRKARRTSLKLCLTRILMEQRSLFIEQEAPNTSFWVLPGHCAPVGVYMSTICIGGKKDYSLDTGLSVTVFLSCLEALLLT